MHHETAYKSPQRETDAPYYEANSHLKLVTDSVNNQKRHLFRSSNTALVIELSTNVERRLHDDLLRGSLTTLEKA